jgi:hypothetical protein
MQLYRNRKPQTTNTISPSSWLKPTRNPPNRTHSSAAACGGFYSVNDWRDGARTLIGKGYLRTPFVLDEDGCVEVPHAPGLGIELDEEGLQEVMARPWQMQPG